MWPVDVDENNHPELLYAIRGGAAAAGMGMIARIRSQPINGPPLMTWRARRLSKAQLDMCSSSCLRQRHRIASGHISVFLLLFRGR
jgi:hypothetical protein